MTDSLTIRIRRKQDGLEIRLNIFSHDAYSREQAQVTALYRHANYTKLPLSELTPEQQEAERKLYFMRNNYQDMFTRLQQGEVVTAQALRHLEPRLPVGFIRIIGINKRGEEGIRSIREGSTVMDYAKDVNPTLWPTTRGFTVNGKPVAFNYVLQTNDTIRVHYGVRGDNIWDPRWIHCFKTDSEGREITRGNVKRMLNKSRESGDPSYRMEVLNAGKWIIEQRLKYWQKPLRVSLHWAREVLNEHEIYLSEEEFFLQLALAENETLTDDLIFEVAQALAEANREVGEITVIFSRDRAGQANAVFDIAATTGVSLPDLQVQTVGRNNPSQVTAFIDPEDKHLMPKIVQMIEDDPRCSRLGLAKVSYSNL